MKRKNFPGRKRQRRIEALEREHKSLLLSAQKPYLTPAEASRINDQVEHVEQKMEEVCHA